MSQVQSRTRYSIDVLAVWVALAVALIVRLGLIKRVPW